MEDALRDGLAGVTHTEDLDATQAMPDDEATRMLATGTRERPRRPLQPIDEPPRRAPQRRQPAPPPRRKKGGAGKWIALVLVLVLIAGGVAAYQAINSGGNREVQLNEEVGGNVDEAIGDFKSLVEDNTR